MTALVILIFEPYSPISGSTCRSIDRARSRRVARTVLICSAGLRYRPLPSLACMRMHAGCFQVGLAQGGRHARDGARCQAREACRDPARGFDAAGWTPARLAASLTMEVDGALGVSGCPGRRMAWNTERAVTAYKQAGSNIAGMRTTS